MSEEEIIEIIEKLQCEYKEQENEKKYNDYTVFKAKEYSKGLEGLLDLYNKEKEKNKELEIKFLVEHTDNLYNKEEASEEMIPRYKIKAKIEELNDLSSPFAQRVIKGKEVYLTEMVQNILQSLLEKE